MVAFKFPSQKELEKKAGRLAEATIHVFTSTKFFVLLVAFIAVIAGIIIRHPEEFKARIAPIYTAIVDGKHFDLPRIPEGFPKFDIFKEDNFSSIGLQLKRDEGLGPKYPFIIVPGFVTSGLELWHGEECARKFFRKRLWAGGNFGMAQTLFSNVDCWLQHMALDEKSGLDKPGINLRAATGLEAVDYFVPGYAVWAKMVQALGDIGYDSNNLKAVTYDWRLAVPNLEIRDAYFSRLKNSVEEFKRIHKRKVIVASHSWGDNVFRAFLQYVDSIDEDWTENNIHTYINLAGPVLGVPKSIPAFLSGETRDTADMGMMSTFLGEKMVPAKRRAALFRTWGAGIGMLPVGGQAIWGNETWAPDDTEEMKAKNQSYGTFMTIVDVTEEAAEKARKWNWPIPKVIARWLQKNETAEEDPIVSHNSVDKAVEVLMGFAGATFRRQSEAWSAALPNDTPCTAINGRDSLHFYHDPLKCPLPRAPSMSMYCLYGVGKPVERAYHYLHLPGPKAKEEQDKRTKAKGEDSEWHINADIDTDGWKNGVLTGDGDGTVPLISSGLLCKTGWREKRLNPGGIRVRQREYKHEPVSSLRDIRGGPKSTDHVDLLGNVDVVSDVLRIAAGKTLEDRFVSNISQIAAKITLPGQAGQPGKAFGIS